MNIQSFKNMNVRAFLVLSAVVLVAISLVSGCSSNSSSSPATATAGGISGVVTASTGTALPGVTVSTSPAAGTTTTDANGNYSLSLPGGSYTLTFTAPNYTSGSAAANVAIGITTPLNVTMAEAASGYPTVAVTASGQNVGFNTSFGATATATSPNGYAMSYTWSGATAGAPATAATGTTVSLTTALAGTAASPTDPGSYVSAYTQDSRFGILPLNADTRGAKSVSVTANDNHGGKTTASVTVYAAGVQPGVKAVALGVPVYMNSGIANDTTSTWTVQGPLSSPTYSTTTSLSTGRNPFFTPDTVGAYVVSKTSAPAASMTIYAGTFAGAISGGSYATKTFSITDPKAGMWFDTTNTAYWASGASSATYTNWPVVTPDSGCLGCHDVSSGTSFSSTAAPDKFTPWKGTAHATFFARGLEGITSNSSSCTTCHTVGSDLATSANNGGYDDMVAATGFVYTKGVGKWAAMSAPTSTYLSAARVSNIQCENCHGPQTTSASPFTTSGAHGTTLSGTSSAPTSTLALRVSYAADVCAQCHSSGTGHHYYSEWVASINPDTGKGHSKLAAIDAGGGHATSTSDSCARCHTAQGFSTYVPQLLSGNSGTLPDSSITWDKTNAQVQTCQACHDSHDATNPNQLRVYDNLSITMAGFGVNGFGKGAVCVACHNIRNGIQCASAPTSTGACGNGGALSPTGATFLHEDAATNGRTGTPGIGNPSDPDAYIDTMHDASQADVFAGRNFFFMGTSLPLLSKHANVEDTCVGCHMKLNPQTHLSHGVPTTNTHVWYIKNADVPTLCANCHSSSVDGAALQATVTQQLAVLGTKMSTNYVNKINSYLAGTPNGIYLGGKASGQISSAATATYSDGTFYITGTLTSGGTSTTIKVSLTNVTTDSAGTLPLLTPSDILKKGNWNWMLINRDGSLGIHNPTLIENVLANTISQAW